MNSIKSFLFTVICVLSLGVCFGQGTSKSNENFDTKVSKLNASEFGAIEQNLQYAYSELLDIPETQGNLDSLVGEYISIYMKEYNKTNYTFLSPSLLLMDKQMKKHVFANPKWGKKYLVGANAKNRFLESAAATKYILGNKQLKSELTGLAEKHKTSLAMIVRSLLYSGESYVSFFLPYSDLSFSFLSKPEWEQLRLRVQKRLAGFEFKNEKSLLTAQKKEYEDKLRELRIKTLIEINGIYKKTYYRQAKFTEEIKKNAGKYEQKINQASSIINKILSEFPGRIEKLNAESLDLEKKIGPLKDSKSKRSKESDLALLQAKSARYTQRLLKAKRLKQDLKLLGGTSVKALFLEFAKEEKNINKQLDTIYLDEGFLNSGDVNISYESIKKYSYEHLIKKQEELEIKRVALNSSLGEFEQFGARIAIATLEQLEKFQINSKDSETPKLYLESVEDSFEAPFNSQAKLLYSVYKANLKVKGKGTALMEYRIGLIDYIKSIIKIHDEGVQSIFDEQGLMKLRLEELKLAQGIEGQNRFNNEKNKSFYLNIHSPLFKEQYDKILVRKKILYQIRKKRLKLETIVKFTQEYLTDEKDEEIIGLYWELEDASKLKFKVGQTYYEDLEEVPAWKLYEVITNPQSKLDKMSTKLEELAKERLEFELGFRKNELAFKLLQKSRQIKEKMPQLLTHDYVAKSVRDLKNGDNPVLTGERIDVKNCTIEWKNGDWDGLTDYYFVIDGVALHKTNDYNEMLMHIHDNFPLSAYFYGCKSNVSGYASIGKFFGNSNYIEARDALDELIFQRVMPEFIRKLD